MHGYVQFFPRERPTTSPGPSGNSSWRSRSPIRRPSSWIPRLGSNASPRADFFQELFPPQAPKKLPAIGCPENQESQLNKKHDGPLGRRRVDGSSLAQGFF